MPKFIKKFLGKRKRKIIDKTGAVMFMDYERKFKLFLKGINGFISGKPSKQEQLAFTLLYKFPGYGVDTKTVCDDAGSEGIKARKRCKLIHKRWRKDKVVLHEDKIWLKRELIPYLKEGFEAQSGKVFELLGKISDEEAKKAYLLFSKNKNKFGGLIK